MEGLIPVENVAQKIYLIRGQWKGSRIENRKLINVYCCGLVTMNHSQ